MKKLIKKLFHKTGYKLVKESYYQNLIHINQVNWLDFSFLINDQLNKGEKIVMIDIGANTGQTTLKFKTYFPGAVIYCFEPIKSTYEILKKNISSLTQVQSFNFAIGDSVTEATVFHRDDSQWNSLVSILNERAEIAGAESEKVKVTTLDKFLLEHEISKVSLLKSDTEGFEMNVLKGAENSLKNQVFDFIYIEVGFHPADRQHTYLPELIYYLEKFNYRFSGLFEKAYNKDFSIAFANGLFTKSPFKS